MLRFPSLILILSVMVPLSSAQADEHRRHEEEHRHHERHAFHHREFYLFDPFEQGLWRSGLWRREWYNGRLGWWWIVNGNWYYYDRPMYPYPQYVSEMVIPEPVIAAPPPYMVAPSAPVMVSPPPPPLPPQVPLQQQPQMWYYCDNPAGYYPYVPSCSTPFRAVPAKPQ